MHITHAHMSEMNVCVVIVSATFYKTKEGCHTKFDNLCLQSTGYNTKWGREGEIKNNTESSLCTLGPGLTLCPRVMTAPAGQTHKPQVYGHMLEQQG